MPTPVLRHLHRHGGAALRPLTLVVTLLAVVPVGAQESTLSQLYAARPPAGSAFVRVINPLREALQVQVASGPAQRIGPQAPATSYAIVAGGHRFTVQVDGKPVATLEAQADHFSSWVLRREGAHYAFTAIDDTGEPPDALKAELRFYNLVPGCTAAQLQIAPAGAAVLRDVPPLGAAARAVNPVHAQLVAVCGTVASPAQALPTLQAGDHLSLFMTGTAARPVLSLQPSRTDAVKR
ncbi:alginate O-acetyltransferase AlgF [Ideonella sp. B508-1]|uniref:alginate O-acetyltransferase AlgF n=1 Tax=Ideonella sp. B508-1 TaxID=137716 RepID=UPI0003B40E50|nr:alginate O-acetyltransferase AlgF [Ideonella sp. B508-1]